MWRARACRFVQWLGCPCSTVHRLSTGVQSNYGAALDLIGWTGLLALWPLSHRRGDSDQVAEPRASVHRAERIGLNGKPFAMLKFRSMVVDEREAPTYIGWGGMRGRSAIQIAV